MPRVANTEARQRILDAAHRLFYTSGLNAVSMDAVAAAAGIKKANLFHYYPNKAALELAVLDHAAQGMNERIASVARHSFDPVGAVQRIFDEAAAVMRQTDCSGGGCVAAGRLRRRHDIGESTTRRTCVRALAA